MLRTVPDLSRVTAEDTRSRILAATREIYARKGSRGTTTREVAELAGVNEATLFRHFGTKGQMISAMLDVYCNRTTYPELIPLLEGPLEEDLRKLMAAAIESLTAKEDLLKIGLAEQVVDHDGETPAFRAPIEARRHLVQYFGTRVAAGELRGEPEDLARIFASLSFSYVMARRIWTDIDKPPEAAIPVMIDVFLNGARAK